MLRTGILYPQLAKVLTGLRYKDTIIIGDAGLSIPKGVKRVDLGWKPDDPAYLDVLKGILRYTVVEGAVLTDGALTVMPDSHKRALDPLPQGFPVEYIPHIELKERSKDVKAIMFTGGFTGYTNMILSAGCAYWYCFHKGACSEAFSSKGGVT